MGTTFLGVKEQGFWVRDGLLELWLRFLALHIEDPSEPGTVATTIRDQWLHASRGFYTGCIPHRMELAVSTDEGQALVRNAVHSLLEALSNAPAEINPTALNLMGIRGEFMGDIETRRLVELGNAFLDLLDGKITSGPKDTSFMPGSR